MPRTLYANGCSMTYGSDLADDQHGQCVSHPRRFRLAWPGQLAPLVGARRVYNNGYPSSSNDRIVRTTLRWIADWLNAGNDASDLLVVIGWSSPMRREFRIGGVWRQIVPHHDYSDIEADILARVYRELAWDTVESCVRFASQVLLMQAYLERLGIEYLFFDALETLTSARASCADEVQPYLSRVDRSRYMGFLQPDGDFAAMGPILERRHPTAQEHAEWARRLAQFMHPDASAPEMTDDDLQLEGTLDAPMFDVKRGRSDKPGAAAHPTVDPTHAAKPSRVSALGRIRSMIRAARDRDPFIYD